MTGSCDDAIFKSISDVDIHEILPQFFLHAKPEVRMVALEVGGCKHSPILFYELLASAYSKL